MNMPPPNIAVMRPRQARRPVVASRIVLVQSITRTNSKKVNAQGKNRTRLVVACSSARVNRAGRFSPIRSQMHDRLTARSVSGRARERCRRS